MEKTQQYSVVVSSRAQRMLGLHIRFLANVSPASARKTKTEIVKAIRSLAIMPQRFSFLDEPQIPPNKYHKMLVDNRYLILYQIKDQTVFIDCIVDCRQDYGWLMK